MSFLNEEQHGTATKPKAESLIPWNSQAGADAERMAVMIMVPESRCPNNSTVR